MSAPGRRSFLAGAGALLFAGGASAATDAGKPKPADVNATEDLMREHGVLRRILLVHDEAIRALASGRAVPAEVFASSTRIIQRFIEGYHEKLEEQFVFPKMLQVGQLEPLVQTLLAQHAAGRKLTAEILPLATPSALADTARRERMVTAVQKFGRMYAPHAAREDTDLFPAYHALFSEAEFDALGDQFEEQEHKLLGASGFEGALKEVAELERTVGIADLAQFTPR